MDAVIQEKRDAIIQRHEKLFDTYSQEERQSAFNMAANFFKDAMPIDFDSVRCEAILKK